MTKETIAALQIQAESWYLDGTFGAGGHTAAMLAQGARVVAFDLDQGAVQAGEQRFSAEIAAGRLILITGNFAHLTRLLKEHDFSAHSLAGALFDLGMSSDQIELSGRGFSFQNDEPLDMRMSLDLGVTAADLVNALPETHLKSLFWDYAQETQASAIAHAIVTARQKQTFSTTSQLADLVTKVKAGRSRTSKLHPATKVFMALRMAVNTELDNLTILLDQITVWLQSGARLVFLSFHEGEDREVKHRFRDWERAGKGSQITFKPVMPSRQEVQRNPRARSARMRVFAIGENI